MSYQKVNWLNKGETGAKYINKTNLNQMDNGIYNLDLNKVEVIQLLTVGDTTPVECERGDKYYDTIDELIYTATTTDTWGTEGETPLSTRLYVDLSSSKLYYYDGTNFDSYGGGGGGETLPVGTELDFDGTSQDIPTGWESVTNPDSYSTSEVKTNKTWTDNKPLYRKVIRNNVIGTSVNHEILNIDEITDIKLIVLQQSGLYSPQNSDSVYMGNTYYIVYLQTTNVLNYKIIVEYTKTTD